MSKLYTKQEVDHSFAWMPLILGVVYVGLVTYFGYQTWELVDHLFPVENLFMKLFSVFSFDVMAAIWLAVKMFGRFHVWSNYGLAKGMWRATFALATLASAIQIYLQAVDFTYTSVDVKIIYAAYALVVIAAVINLVALGHMINTEWDAVHPHKFYAPLYGSDPQLPGVLIQEPGRVQPKEETPAYDLVEAPAPRQLKQLPPMKRTGEAGRNNTDLNYARLWVSWEETGVCPWRNPREMKKHPPKDEFLRVAQEEWRSKVHA